MSKQKTTRGKTSRSLPVFIADTSSATGGGLSGVTSASSGLVLEYRRQGQSTWTNVTPQAGKTTLGSYLSGGILADGSLAGAYEVDFPDAAFASAAGVEWVALRIRGVTNMLPVLIEIELDAVDYQDAAAFGLSKFADIETDTQNIQSRIPAALVDGRIVANAQIVGDKTGYTATVSDKTGFKLASDGLALVTAWTVGITGNLTGSVGSINGVSFPANFSSLGISPTGVILTVGMVEELSSGALTANGAVDAIPPAVWNALTTTTYTDQSFGDRLLISTSNNRDVAVTVNNHVAAVLHGAQANSIPEDAFQNGAVSARVIAADAIDGDAMAASALTEIANAVGTLQVLVDMGLMIVNDGTADARFSISALQNGPAGEGGAVINVYPVSASTPERVAGTTITYYRNEIRTVSVVTDFTLTALTLTFTVEDSEGTDLLTIPDGSINRSDKTFTVSIGTAVTATISNYRWALRDITGGSNSVIARGVLTVQEAASA